MINIDDLTLGQLKEIAAQFNQQSPIQKDAPSPFWEIGKPYLIRTVTMIDAGTLVTVTEHEIVLRDAIWIADTGRFSAALYSCEFSEVEPFPEGLTIINRGSVIDCIQIAKVPRAVK